ncbi:MAG: hypothetical protein ACXWYS_04070 [Gaiellaceae bacterium]
MKVTWALAATACAAALLLAGCGGGSDDSSSSTTTTTTTTTTTSGEPARNARLSEADWAEYEQQAAQAKSVNDTAIKTFQKCRKLVDAQAPSDQIQSCFGDTASSVVTEGQQLLTFIADVGQTVGGACGTATGNLYEGVKLYISSVNAIGLSSQGGTVPPIQTVDTAKRTLVAVRSDTAAFENACKPV